MSANNTEWANEYEKMDIYWCDLSEEYIDAINVMLIELTYYDPSYGEIQPLINFDCWETLG